MIWLTLFLMLVYVVFFVTVFMLSAAGGCDLVYWAMVVEWFWPRQDDGRNGKKRRTNTLDNDIALKEEFKLIRNGPPNRKGPKIMIHRCHPSWPCKCTSLSHSRQRQKLLILRVDYKRRPAPPQMSEWTSVSWKLIGPPLTPQ